MRIIKFLLLALVLGWSWPVATHGKSLPLFLYHQVTGGEEDYQVPRGMSLSRLAQEKGVRWQVLARYNGLKKPYHLKPGMVLRINTSHIVPTDLSQGMVINLPELKVYFFYKGVYQRRYALAIGKRSWPTPTGNYYIRNKERNPTWVVPVSIQEEMEEMGQEVLERVPPGPKNPLGSYWLGTSAPGVGIHATNRPWSVGHSVSHGCMRMHPEDIADLYPLVEVGTPVKIIYQPAKMALTYQGRIYLEAYPDVYGYKIDTKAWAEQIAQAYGLENRIDWDKAFQVLKEREGIARDITKDTRKVLDSPKARETRGAPSARLLTLQSYPAKIQ